MVCLLGKELRMTEINIPVRNGNLIHSLTMSYSHGVANLKNIPALVKRVLGEKMYEDFVTKSTQERKQYDTFREFVEALTPYGLETDMETLRAICHLVDKHL